MEAGREVAGTHGDSGHWRCPPGEEAAASLGLSYRVRSSEELHPGYIRNLIFLEEYFFDCIVYLSMILALFLTFGE